MFDSLPLLIGLLLAPEVRPIPGTVPTRAPTIRLLRLPPTYFTWPRLASPPPLPSLPAETPQAVQAWWHEGAVVDKVEPARRHWYFGDTAVAPTRPKREP